MKCNSAIFLVNIIMIGVESYNFPVQNAPVLCNWYDTKVDCSISYKINGGGIQNPSHYVHSQRYVDPRVPIERNFRRIPSFSFSTVFRYPLTPDSYFPKFHTRSKLLPPYALYPIQSDSFKNLKHKMIQDTGTSQFIRPLRKLSTLDFRKKYPVMLHLTTTTTSTNSIFSNNYDENETTTNTPYTNTNATINISLETKKDPNETLYESFLISLDELERKFYSVTFLKLSSISPVDRRENGISFIQSGLSLYLHLISLLNETDPDVQEEIIAFLGRSYTEEERIHLIRKVSSSLPTPNDELKFLWSSRLILAPSRRVSQDFLTEVASALELQVEHFHGNETAEIATQKLNAMVELDSGGSMHNTFDEEELSDGICAVLLSVTYVRATWRTSPTLLNNPKPFYDDEKAPQRTVRMIKVNDIMRYAALNEWNAQAMEVPYSTSGLSLLIIVPRSRSLRSLAAHVASTSIHKIIGQMKTMRVAAILPLYTLRMALLLPSKLLDVNITHLVNATNCNENNGLKLSHAVQRIMFWAEAGRNAFKEDGIEWDLPPALEVLVDRPYLFFVRWHNITLLNGNFVL